jgi:adenylate cyclase
VAVAGCIEEAKAEYLQAEKIVPTQARQGLGQLLVATGEFHEALKLMRNEPESVARAQCLALAYHGLGRKAQAAAALGALIASYGESDPLMIAEVYAYRGQADEAFKWLQKNDEKYSSHPNLGNPKVPWIVNRSPFFKSLQADARWNAWLATDPKWVRTRARFARRKPLTAR